MRSPAKQTSAIGKRQLGTLASRRFFGLSRPRTFGFTIAMSLRGRPTRNQIRRRDRSTASFSILWIGCVPSTHSAAASPPRPAHFGRAPSAPKSTVAIASIANCLPRSARWRIASPCSASLKPTTLRLMLATSRSDSSGAASSLGISWIAGLLSRSCHPACLPISAPCSLRRPTLSPCSTGCARRSMGTCFRWTIPAPNASS